jgi:hypothetical protein
VARRRRWLLAGSPAINAGDNTLVPNGITTDQRGSARVTGAVVDIGAFEGFILGAPTSAAISAPSFVVGSGGSVKVTVGSAVGTPTGSVSLSVDGGTAQTMTLSGGSATFTLSALPVGNHTLHVIYAAQGSFAATTADSTLHVLALQPLTWTNASSNVTVNGNNLSITPAGNWGSGAGSPQTISSGDAFVQFTVPSNTRNEALGFTHQSPTHDYSKLDFSLLLTANGEVTIYESNHYIGLVGYYSSGDSFRISIVSGKVDYYQEKSGSTTWTLLHQSTPSAITYPLTVDTSFNSPGGSFSNVLIGPAVGFSTTAVPAATAGAAYNQQISAAGSGTVSFAVTAGSLPGNVTLSSAGLLSGTPTTPGTYTFTVTGTDAVGASASEVYTLTVNLPVTTLIWQNVSSNVTVSGNNLSISSAGNWGSGAGSAQTVSSGDAFVQFTVPSNTRNEALGFTHLTPTHDYSKLDFSLLLTVNGEVTIYEHGSYVGLVGYYSGGDSFRITVVSGQVDYYQQKSGSSAWTLLHQSNPSSITYPLAVDTSFNSPGGSFTNVLIGLPVVFTTTAVPATTAGVAYNQQLNATGSGAVTFAVTAGSLPANVTLSSAGLLSGTPTTPGTYTFTVTATDALGASSEVYTLTVNPALSITTPILPTAATGGSYSQQLASGGGTGTVTYTVTAGAPPTGLSLSASGLLSGTASSVGASTFTVTATDSVGATATRTYTLGSFTPQAVAWQHVSSTVTASGNNLTSTAAGNWGTGAGSTKAIAAGSDGFVQFTATETTTIRALGLTSQITPSHSYAGLDYGIVLNGGKVYIYEDGVNKKPLLTGLKSATYGSGDSFRVAIEAGVVHYYQQKAGSSTWTLLYQSASVPTQALHVDTSFFDNNATISNVLLAGNLM